MLALERQTNGVFSDCALSLPVRRAPLADRAMMWAPRLAAKCTLLLLIAVLLTRPALADPWVPPAGNGVVKPMLRYFTGDRAFPSSGFSSTTVPASKETAVQLRTTGVLGLGHDLSLEYDLRGARVQTSRRRNSQEQTRTSTGLQDQEVGLNYGLTQTPAFAQSIELNMVAPTGRTEPPPSLGAGRWAAEPDYQLGLRHGRFGATLIFGPRVFLDGGATQLRATLGLSVNVLPRLTLYNETFFVRTIRQVHALPPGAAGEDYNLLRIGVGIQYRLTRRFRPFAAYDNYVAGQGVHAGNRVTVGVAIHF